MGEIAKKINLCRQLGGKPEQKGDNIRCNGVDAEEFETKFKNLKDED